MEKKEYVMAFVMLLTHWGYAQKAIDGHIVNCLTNTSIPYANILHSESGTGSISDVNGRFTLMLKQADSVHIQVSCIGYTTVSQWVKCKATTVHICLKPFVHELNQISVIAEERVGSATASLIKTDAMKHLQASSFADVLQLLPGGLSKRNDLTTMKLITMREVGSAVKSNYNSSLGTAFVIDGTPLINDAQMQNIPGSSSDIKLGINSRNTTGKGIDLRNITTDDIESVEIIRGIPSVKYGDLTTGVVVINRGNVPGPVKIRLKSSANAKQVAIGKGFRLNHKQVLNTSLSYIRHVSDPRNKELNYSRHNASLRYKRKHCGRVAKADLSLNGDYTGTFDKQRVDPQKGNPVTDKYNNAYHRMGVSSVVNWSFTSCTWWESLKLSTSVNYTTNQKEIDRFVSTGRTIPFVFNTKDGVQDGIYLEPGYQTHLKTDDKPLYITSNIESIHTISNKKVRHKLFWGINYRYSKNRGEGQIFDPQKPPFPQVRSRPRPPKDIPSIQYCAVYFEDNASITLGKHKLKGMFGIRASSMPKLNKAYSMRKQVYYDPRVNINWQLPGQELFNNVLHISFHAGYGKLHKFPTLSHLYPEKNYFDILQLNFYSQQKELSRLNFITYSHNPVNYNIQPSNNQKAEAGFLVKWGSKKLSLTLFKEQMESGFLPLSQYRHLNYTNYDASSVSVAGLTKAPDLNDFKSESNVTTVLFNQYINAGLIVKKGIEYQLDFGHVQRLSTRITINGAWFNTIYDQSLPEYRLIDGIIDGKEYPYIPLYDWNRGHTHASLNTNLRLDTNIKPLGLMFSSLLQTLWYTGKQNNRHNGMPAYYVDKAGAMYRFKPEDINDPLLIHMYDKPSEDQFDKEIEAIAVALNLTVTKRINEQTGFSFYVNNILDYTPDYYRKDGLKVKRRVLPWFGMELNINI